MTCAVVIPCRNEAAHIGALLDALAAQTVRPDEVVVVDDGSTDGTADVVAQWSSRNRMFEVQLVAGSGRGPGAAMNVGIRTTQADVIIRFDGHSRPEPEYVQWSLATVSTPSVGVAGGVWRISPGAATPVAAAIAAVVSHPLGSGGALYRHPDVAGDNPVRVETVPFGTFRRSLWEQLGGFDEALSANEDFDFNYRARKLGQDVVLDRRIKATYFARATLGALARQYFRYGFWKFQMLRKDPRALHWRQLPPALVLPWIFFTIAWMMAAPGALSGAAAMAYPAVVLAGAVHLALGGTSAVAAFAAFFTVHVAWSSGLWCSMFVRRQASAGRSASQSGRTDHN
ncbi:MAG: glycosyltransferase family 2 protein [Acidobacteria bacterium]|nr:glycosyltransferase family 2 protein [Acidobacteriota bacterium]